MEDLLPYLILLFPISLAIYGLLLWLLPAGSLLHEAIWIPILWYRVLTSDRSAMVENRWTYGSHRRQYLLSFSPPNQPARKTTLVYIHGGGWRMGAPENFRGNAKVFVQEGYHIILPSYRRLPWHNYRAMREDLGNIWQQIHQILQAEGQEGNELILLGMSSGAHLAAMLAFDKALHKKAPLSTKQIAGLVLMGAPVDLDQMLFSPPIFQLAGLPNRPLYHLANPINYLQTDTAIDLPTLFVHGDRDAMVPLRSAQSFANRMEALGNHRIDFELLEGGSHLDAVSWSHTNNQLRKRILEWMAARESIEVDG